MFKETLVEKILHELPDGNRRILELGSGRSNAVASYVRDDSSLSYRGIEPFTKDFLYAREHIGSLSNVRLDNTTAYEIGEESLYGACFSLSVLEHVKYLDRFLEQSVRAVVPGGSIVHQYDLGHALHPSNIKERFQVWLGTTIPSVLPEKKFVRYLAVTEVTALLEKYGATIDSVTYHQMPNHKEVSQYLTDSIEKTSAAQKLVDWEFSVSPLLSDVPQAVRERLFPTITIWAHKK